LQLNPQPVWAEDLEQLTGCRLVMDPMVRASRQADKTLCVTKYLIQRNLWLPDRTARSSFTRMGVAGRDYSAEVAPPGCILNEKSQVATIVKGYLSPMDRPHTSCFGSVCKLHRAAEVVVVRQGQRAVSPRSCSSNKLIWQRSTIVKRKR
jgi:hypothetical protein